MKDIKHGTKLVPKLRFKEFDGEWKKDSTKKLVSFIKDGTHGTHKDTPNGEYYLLSAKNIINGSVVITEDERKISKSEFDKITSSYKLEENDILLTIVGSIGQLALYKGHSNCAFQRSVAFLRFGRIDANYAFHYLNSYYYQKELLKRKVTSAQPGIYLGELAKIEVPFPTIPEQQKIAYFLTAVDKRIEQLTKKKKLLEVYKKGVMQKIFNQEIRFKDENGNEFPDWEEKRLGDILKLTLRPSDKPNENYLSIGIRSHGKGTFQKPDTDPNSISIDTLYQVKKDDLIVNITFAWEGAIAIVKAEDDGGYVSHRFPTYTSRKDASTPEYLEHVIKGRRFKYLLSTISPGGAGRNRVLNRSDFLKLKIKLPIIDEQVMIASLLNGLDKQIEQALLQLDKENSYKKGLLQQMFI